MIDSILRSNDIDAIASNIFSLIITYNLDKFKIKKWYIRSMFASVGDVRFDRGWKLLQELGYIKSYRVNVDGCIEWRHDFTRDPGTIIFDPKTGRSHFTEEVQHLIKPIRRKMRRSVKKITESLRLYPPKRQPKKTPESVNSPSKYSETENNTPQRDRSISINNTKYKNICNATSKDIGDDLPCLKRVFFELEKLWLSSGSNVGAKKPALAAMKGMTRAELESIYRAGRQQNRQIAQIKANGGRVRTLKTISNWLKNEDYKKQIAIKPKQNYQSGPKTVQQILKKPKSIQKTRIPSDAEARLRFFLGLFGATKHFREALMPWLRLSNEARENAIQAVIEFTKEAKESVKNSIDEFLLSFAQIE
jgi:hypothetical protein